MARKEKIGSEKDFFKELGSGLRTAATRPNIHGYIPHEEVRGHGQVTFHTSGARGKLFIGGNRSGKTVGGACEAVWWLTGTHPYRRTPPPPVRGRCVTVDIIEGLEKIVKPEIARWMPKSELVNGSWEDSYSKEYRTLTLANGSTLEFLTYEQDVEKHAGTSRHFIWFDEEPPKDIYVENMLRLLDTGGSWWITMTPVEGMTWVYDDVYIKARTDPNLKVIEVDTTMNPHLNPGDIDIVMSGLSEDEKKARIHGRFVQRGGLIYKTFGKSNIVKPIIPLELDQKEWLHFAGMDHGLNNPTAWLWGACDREGRVVIYDEHYQSGLVVSEHARIVHERNKDHRLIPSYNVGDPSIRNTDPITGTSVLIEYIDNGIPIVLGNNDVKAGIDSVAKRFGEENNPRLPRRLFITRNCTNLLWELARYRWATWATKKMDFEKNKKEEPNKKDDHACDALRYMIASRPLVEDGSIPEPSIPLGAKTGVDPYGGRVDPGTSRKSLEQDNFDDILGSEW